MESVIRLGLWPGPQSTHVVATGGASETILKATLPLRPANVRAVTTLFEALALWAGRPVRAVLVADEWSTRSCPTTLYHETFALFGDQAGLYELEWVSAARARRRREARGAGSFEALERVLRRRVFR